MTLRFFSLLVALFWIAACSSFRGPGKTVEIVLRESKGTGEQFDRQESRRTLASKSAPSFDTPLHTVVITSPYGRRFGRRHQGVDLKAAVRTPIYAAERGIVVFVGDGIRGYGDTAIVRHRSGYSTLYAHASGFTVAKGDSVSRGDLIGYTGDSGNVSGPHLHFEIRRGEAALDPLTHLPSRLKNWARSFFSKKRG